MARLVLLDCLSLSIKIFRAALSEDYFKREIVLIRAFSTKNNRRQVTQKLFSIEQVVSIIMVY